VGKVKWGKWKEKRGKRRYFLNFLPVKLIIIVFDANPRLIILLLCDFTCVAAVLILAPSLTSLDLGNFSKGPCFVFVSFLYFY
jgi:hypothetical protein